VCRYGDWSGGHPQKCKVTDDLDVSVNIRTCGQCIMKFENAVRAVAVASTNETPPFIIFIFVNAIYLQNILFIIHVGHKMSSQKLVKIKKIELISKSI
jgi:hypothetical protein